MDQEKGCFSKKCNLIIFKYNRPGVYSSIVSNLKKNDFSINLSEYPSALNLFLKIVTQKGKPVFSYFTLTETLGRFKKRWMKQIA